MLTIFPNHLATERHRFQAKLLHGNADRGRRGSGCLDLQMEILWSGSDLEFDAAFDRFKTCDDFFQATELRFDEDGVVAGRCRHHASGEASQQFERSTCPSVIERACSGEQFPHGASFAINHFLVALLHALQGGFGLVH